MKWEPRSYTLGREGHKARAKKVATDLKEKLAADK
jgi:hypothetical protein